ncbi:MAG: D-aminoacyl-tRNA deacylase [Candidatus Dormibacteria bacterium]
MRGVVQRVTFARVRVGEELVAEIGMGLLLYLGVGPSDDGRVAARMAQRLSRLRIFADEMGRMNRSLLEAEGEALVVSQFTLFADSRRGHRPSFLGAAPPDLGRELCLLVADELRRQGVLRVAEGRFGANMTVQAANQGPVTVVVTSGEGDWRADCG